MSGFDIFKEIDQATATYGMCEAHPDRKGILTVDMPSLDIRRFMCPECRLAFNARMTPYKGKREAWEADLAQGARDTYGTDPYGRSLRTEADTFDRRWK